LAQLGVFTVAPIAEGVAAGATSAVHAVVEVPSENGSFAHDPNGCAACELTHGKAFAPGENRPTTIAAANTTVAPDRQGAAAPSACETCVLSRAPPALVA
jgi:hypothetical protein